MGVEAVAEIAAQRARKASVSLTRASARARQRERTARGKLAEGAPEGGEVGPHRHIAEDHGQQRRPPR